MATCATQDLKFISLIASGKLNSLNSLKRVATIESVGSSTRIEGAKLTDEQVEALLSKLEQQSFSSRDEQEVAGYANAMDMVFDSFEYLALSENHIKQLHGELLKYCSKDDGHRGEYKNITNNVEAFDANGESLGVVFQTSTPFETPLMMNALLDWYTAQDIEKAQHPLLVIAVFIVVFLAIHPFEDGNGRLSRILTTLLLLRHGYAYVPYSSMETVIEANKENYYLSLKRTQQTIRSDKQNWQPWVIFFLRTMVKQKDNLAFKIDGERKLRENLPALSRSIMRMASTDEEVTVRDLEAATGANRNTIKAHLKKLVAQEYLRAVGKGRGARYKIKR